MNNGGPAFPVDRKLRSFAGQEGDRITEMDTDDGMSLRDYFAAHEATLPPMSWIQCEVGSHVEALSQLRGVELSEALAKWRYQMADAMLARREMR